MTERRGDNVVLITGGTGFIGAHCLARLVTEDCIVHAANRQGRGPAADRVTWHAADLRDPAAASDLVRKVRPARLLLGAWNAVPGQFWTAPDNKDWLAASVAMVRAFAETGGRHFVGVGTCAEYDWQQTEFREDETPLRPSTLYGQAKAALAEVAFTAAGGYGFTAAWGRIFQPYGVGETSPRFIPAVIEALIEKRPIDLTHGRQERDFIFAPDVADLLVRLLMGGQQGAYNVGTGRATSLRAVAQYIGGKLGRSDLLRFGTRQAPVSEPMRLVADMTKVRDRLQWSASTTVEAGLDELVNRALGVATGHAEPPEGAKKGIF